MANKDPCVADFSQKATSKAVRNAVFQHDATLWPFAVGFLGFVGACLFPAAWIPVVAIAGGGIGTGSLIVNYCFRKDAFASAYLNDLRKKMEEHKREVLANLQHELKTFEKGTELWSYANQAYEQFDKVEEKFTGLREILSKKLNEGEITFARYYGTAEQVYLAVLDNLNNVVDSLKVAKKIDIKYIDKRLKELARLKTLAEADQKEIVTLNKRKKLWDQQCGKVNTLLTKNEEAMTEIDATAVALTEMKTVKGAASQDLESSREQLEELAKRVQQYNIVD